MSVHSLRGSVHNTFATIHLFRDCFAHKFENSRVTKVRTLLWCWVTIISPTGGSQQWFVNSQTKILPGYPCALFAKPIKGVPGYPGSILVWPLTNHCWLPPVGLIIVTQHRESVLTFVMRLFSNLWAKQSRNKCIVAKTLWTESRSEWTDMELQHLFFDSTEELSRQGCFQWIYSLRAAGTPEISVRPCLSFSSGNPQNDNSTKLR